MFISIQDATKEKVPQKLIASHIEARVDTRWALLSQQSTLCHSWFSYVTCLYLVEIAKNWTEWYYEMSKDAVQPIEYHVNDGLGFRFSQKLNLTLLFHKNGSNMALSQCL